MSAFIAWALQIFRMGFKPFMSDSLKKFFFLLQVSRSPVRCPAEGAWIFLFLLWTLKPQPSPGESVEKNTGLTTKPSSIMRTFVGKDPAVISKLLLKRSMLVRASELFIFPFPVTSSKTKLRVLRCIDSTTYCPLRAQCLCTQNACLTLFSHRYRCLPAGRSCNLSVRALPAEKGCEPH